MARRLRRRGGRDGGFFLQVPDEIPRPGPRRRGGTAGTTTLDLVDWLYEFRAAFGRDPASWRDLNYGMDHLARAAAREKLRIWDAHSAASGLRKDVRDWHDEQRLIGGL